MLLSLAKVFLVSKPNEKKKNLIQPDIASLFVMNIKHVNSNEINYYSYAKRCCTQLEQRVHLSLSLFQKTVSLDYKYTTWYYTVNVRGNGISVIGQWSSSQLERFNFQSRTEQRMTLNNTGMCVVASEWLGVAGNATF